MRNKTAKQQEILDYFELATTTSEGGSSPRALWLIGGDYGYEYYEKYNRLIEEAKLKPERSQKRSLRTIVICAVIEVIEKEMSFSEDPASISYIKQVIVDNFNKEELEKINESLISMLLDV